MKAKSDVGSLIDAQETSESISPVPQVLSDILNTLNERLFVSELFDQRWRLHMTILLSQRTTHKQNRQEEELPVIPSPSQDMI